MTPDPAPATAHPPAMKEPGPRRRRKMFVPTLIMAGLAICLVIAAQLLGRQGEAFNASWRMLASLLPLLLCAFVVAGYVQTLLPEDKVAQWLGPESGPRGLLLATLAGALCPGGPFVSMPIAAAMLGTGAGLGTMVAFMTSWSLLGVHRLPLEVGILGWRFTAIRFLVSLVLPPVAGAVAQFVFSRAVEGGATASGV